MSTVATPAASGPLEPIERAITTAPQTLDSLGRQGGRLNIEHGQAIFLDGKPRHVSLPDKRILFLNGVHDCRPFAVFCPWCAKEIDESNGDLARDRVRLAMVRYGRVGFRSESRGQGRSELSVISACTCEHGHVLNFNNQGQLVCWKMLPSAEVLAAAMKKFRGPA